MKAFRKCMLLILIPVLLLSGCLFGGEKKIGRDAAFQIALTDAGLTADQVVDVDIETERDLRSAWYEVSFESGRTEYDYKINAYSGEIIFAGTD